jgi:hypothetical protein
VDKKDRDRKRNLKKMDVESCERKRVQGAINYRCKCAKIFVFAAEGGEKLKGEE